MLKTIFLLACEQAAKWSGAKKSVASRRKKAPFFPPRPRSFLPARLKYTFFIQGNKFILQFFFAISIVWDVLKPVKHCIFGLLGY